MSYPSDLFRAIFTPGAPPALLLATNVSFACLQVTLLAMLFITTSIHFVFLSLLCAGVWGGINWFVHEVAALQRIERQADEIRRVQAELNKDAASSRELDDTEEESESDNVLLDTAQSTAVQFGEESAPAASRRRLDQDDEEEDDFEKVEKEDGYETEGRGRKMK
ncbi:V-type ATPase assembly factor [Drechslerella dactyloides]|uniref:V-type ATPase assembly factor n=1 Tax=Drechslerella dactyloides TaxID=74499 RepID=A0AAD6NLC3_DREDA|nr:V-type ATPase assembly factor [Drechslerella dactyloides]